mmetsp:Transcript_10069/g.30253  ORF Transcript_10069/g.30253 Transcript_10069/m.30253 type:complete len:93 (+) Transcript_10069:338-616(+)
MCLLTLTTEWSTEWESRCSLVLSRHVLEQDLGIPTLSFGLLLLLPSLLFVAQGLDQTTERSTEWESACPAGPVSPRPQIRMTPAFRRCTYNQ